MSRLVWPLLVAFSLLASAGTAVLAHANLDRSLPAAGARLAQPPPLLELRFTQDLKPEGSWVQLEGARSGRIGLELRFDPADRRLIQALLPPLPPDIYTVRWQSLSAEDDDYADGSFSFTLLNPDGSAPNGAATTLVEGEGDNGAAMLLIAAAASAVVVGGAALFAVRGRRSR